MADTGAPRPLAARVVAWALMRKPVRAFLLYIEHRGPLLADSVTYRTLFSIFAGVLLGFSVAALWLSGNPGAWEALIGAVNSAIPGLIGKNRVIDLDNLPAQGGLTVAGIISVIALLGAAVGAIGALRTALRTLADRLNGDVFFVWVLLRNLALGVGVGVALAASALITVLASSGLDLIASWFGIGEESPFLAFVTQAVSVLIVFALDTVVIAVLFVTLSGVKAPARALWTGSLIGGVGLVVLQQLSSLFVGGAGSNPLLASFGTLIALLLWLNLSAQVILLASAYIITGVEEHEDRVSARHGAATFAQRRVRRAERSVRVATDELTAARAAEEKEREGANA